MFLRVQNTTDEALTPANDFEIVDTQENVYRPIPLDTNVNIVRLRRPSRSRRTA